MEYNIQMSSRISKNKEKIYKKHVIVLDSFLERMENIDGMSSEVYKYIQKKIKKINFDIEDKEFYIQKYYEIKGKQTSIIPTVCYSIKDKTVYVLADAYIRPGLIATELSKQTERILLHETLYAVACDNKSKLGFMTVYKNEEKIEKVIGQGINKAATIDISHKILGETRVNGVPQDYEAVLNVIKALLMLTEEEYLKMYFVKKSWYDVDLEKKFNAKKFEEKPLLFIINEYDSRKKICLFESEKVADILIDAYNSKTKKDREVIHNKFMENIEIFLSYFDLSEKINKIKEN